MQSAKLTNEEGHVWWHCPNCGRRMAEIIRDRVVIRNGKEVWTMRVRNKPETTCPRCLAESTVREEDLAA